MFKLNISVTSANLDAIKAELNRTFPEVKSSHRCEALARGLGFRTYAALLTATRLAEPVIATANGAAFYAYLTDHGFDIPLLSFYRPITRVALRAVLEKMPKLTMLGIGVGEPQRKPDGTRESGRDIQAKFDAEREALLSDYVIEPFLLCLAFLAKVKSTKTIRQGTGSYWLKHIAENYACTYPEGDTLGPNYVANGVLIAAAVHAGFTTKTYVGHRGYDDLNVSFNMSKPSLEDLDCEIRANGARAQDRRRREYMRNNKTRPFGF